MTAPAADRRCRPASATRGGGAGGALGGGASRGDVREALHPVVVLAALLLATVPYAAGHTGPKYAYMVRVFFVVACPCALVLSTPVVAVCGSRARRGGVCWSRDRRNSRGWAGWKEICVDKTGTLTEGRFTMTQVKLATPRTEGQKTQTRAGEPARAAALGVRA